MTKINNKKKDPIFILTWKTSNWSLKFWFMYYLVHVILAFFISIQNFIFHILIPTY
jgi:hypothetical protein